MRALRYANTFRTDFNAQAGYAIDRGEHDQAVRLTEDIVDLERLLTDFPEAGREIDRRGARALRKIKLRRCPFIVWYATDPRKTVLARLFHARQRTPRPRLP